MAIFQFHFTKFIALHYNTVHTMKLLYPLQYIHYNISITIYSLQYIHYNIYITIYLLQYILSFSYFLHFVGNFEFM